MSALDRYDPRMLDDDEYSELSQGDRAAAERTMRKRDRAAGIARDDRDLLYGKFCLQIITTRNSLIHNNICLLYR